MNLEDKDIKKFLQTHPKTNFMQSPEWAKVKTDWKNEFIVVRDENNKVKGTMSILLRKVPIFNRYIMYAPRGFVCDIYDKETLNELTKTEENWLSFLDSSSWNFKYDFADQILIYAQRPEATACDDIETWNNKVKRWINKNANGIFIFDNNENSKYPFKLVFDVSDTHNYKGTPYKLWSVEEKYETDIIESLNATFGAESEKLELSKSITLNAYNMVNDNIQDYISSIKKYTKGTQFEQYIDDELYSLFVPCVWASVSYMMMTRCGINARKKIDIKEFEYIKYFNNENLITILGQAVSDIAEMGLREIAKTIKNLQIEEKNKNRTFVKIQNGKCFSFCNVERNLLWII